MKKRTPYSTNGASLRMANAENRPIKVTVKWELITPKKAKKILGANPRNRAVQNQTILRYARTIAEGRWLATHQAIAIDRDGFLIDGQHRLWAVVHSSTPIWAIVVRGLDPHVRISVDRGAQRSIVDNIRLYHMVGNKGISDITDEKAKAIQHRFTTRILSAARLFYQVPVVQCASFSEYDMEVILNKIGVSIQWAIDRIGAGKIGRRELYTLVARAHRLALKKVPMNYFEGDADWIDIERLARFCDCIKTGVVDNKDDSAAMKARDAIVERVAKKNGGYGAAVDLYRKLQWCLAHFLARSCPRSAKAEDVDIFPILDGDNVELLRTKDSLKLNFNKDQLALLASFRK